ncbi:hypothetical protein Fmac_030100 [Flemingia macrophylla]|uniref:Uncharacterized protein n=1 Tax=Flemingia macrophylla TaxID=520843 RepID=A0ABD1LC77_9FABA
MTENGNVGWEDSFKWWAKQVWSLLSEELISTRIVYRLKDIQCQGRTLILSKKTRILNGDLMRRMHGAKYKEYAIIYAMKPLINELMTHKWEENKIYTEISNQIYSTRKGLSYDIITYYTVVLRPQQHAAVQNYHVHSKGNLRKSFPETYGDKGSKKSKRKITASMVHHNIRFMVRRSLEDVSTKEYQGGFSHLVSKPKVLQGAALSDFERLVTSRASSSLDVVTFIKTWLKLLFLNQRQPLTCCQLWYVPQSERMCCLVRNMNFSTWIKHLLSISQECTH